MRILTALERVAIWHEAANPITLYRGINLDTNAPGLEQVHAILHPQEGEPDWKNPALARHLLDWMQIGGGTPDYAGGPRSGLGRHWSEDPSEAERFARWPREDTGRGGNLQAVLEAEWPGEGEDLGRTRTREFDEQGKRIRSFPQERERTLSPGASVGVKSIRVRPYDDAYWNSPADLNGPPPDENYEGPWRQLTLPETSSHTAMRY